MAQAAKWRVNNRIPLGNGNLVDSQAWHQAGRFRAKVIVGHVSTVAEAQTMNRNEAKIEAAKRWGGLAKIVRRSWFDHLAGMRLVEFQVGEVTNKGFAVYGRSAESWEKAFASIK